MNTSSCALCGVPHAGPCSPGRARRGEIAFPAWTRITQCERRPGSVIVRTPHGIIRREVVEPTAHGRTMAAWREREVATDGQQP